MLRLGIKDDGACSAIRENDIIKIPNDSFSIEVVSVKVLVCIDGTESSEDAFLSVLRRTWPAPTEFVLTSIVADADVGKYLGTKIANAAQHARDESTQFFDALLSEKARQLHHALPDCAVRTHIECGDVSSSIVNLAADIDVDLIVMGSHCRHGVSKYAMGSIVESVVSHTPSTVEVIRRRLFCERLDCVDVGPAIYNPTKILICFDGSKNAEAALEWLNQAQWKTEQEFVVLTVLAPLDDHMKKVDGYARRSDVLKLKKKIKKDAEKFLYKVLERLPGKLVEAVVADGYAAEVIIEFARKWPADLVVIGACSDTRDTQALGSVAKAVAAECPCSVRVIKRKDTDDPYEFAEELQAG